MMAAAITAHTISRTTLLQPVTPFQASLVCQSLHTTGYPESKDPFQISSSIKTIALV